MCLEGGRLPAERLESPFPPSIASRSINILKQIYHGKASTSRHMFKVKCPIIPHKAPTWAYLQKYVTTTPDEPGDDALFGFVHTSCWSSLSLPYLFFIRIFHCRTGEGNKMLKFILTSSWRWSVTVACWGASSFVRLHAKLLLSGSTSERAPLEVSRTLQVASTSQVVAVAATSYKYCSTGSLCYCFLALFPPPTACPWFHLFPSVTDI